VWLDVQHNDHAEHAECDVAVGAVVVHVDNRRVYLLDDDKQVLLMCLTHVTNTKCLFVQLTVDASGALGTPVLSEQKLIRLMMPFLVFVK